MGLRALFAAVLFATATPASARTIIAATVGTSSAQVLAAPTNGERYFLSIDNESASATIACAFGRTAALNTAGSYTIAASQARIWQMPQDWYNHPIPSGAVNCIASAASTPVTIESDP
jgi:hypothetical protein